MSDEIITTVLSRGELLFPSKEVADRVVGEFGREMLGKMNRVGGEVIIYYEDEQGRLVLMERAAKP